MAVDIDGKNATLKISHFNDGYTKGKKFNFALPVSEPYEVSFSEIVATDSAYIKCYTNGIEMKYAQKVLYLEIECTEEQGFCLDVGDAEHTYKARRYYRNMEQIEVEGMDVFVDDKVLSWVTQN